MLVVGICSIVTEAQISSGPIGVIASVFNDITVTDQITITDGTDPHIIKAATETGIGGRLTFGLDETSRLAVFCDYGDIDAEFITGSVQKVFVYVNSILLDYDATPAAGKYKISGSTLTFGTAPSNLPDNIRVVFSVMDTGDLCRIYKKLDSESYADTDIIMEGIIERPTSNISPSNTKELTIKGVGAIEYVFAALVFVKNTALTKPEEVIQSCITQINNYNVQTGRKITGQDSTEWTALSNATTSADIQYTASYKSALEVIEEVSSDRYTNNGNHYFFVKFDGTTHNFYWKSKSASLTAGLSITEGEPKILNIFRDEGEVINAVIYNVGLDCYEVPQEFPNFGNTSIGGHGIKWKYVIATNSIISDLLAQEFENDPSLWPQGTDLNRTSNFPTDTSSWSFQFEGRNDDGTKTGSAATATTDATFNDAIKKEAQAIGKEATNRILDLYSAPRLKAEATYPFTKVYDLGDLVPITSPSYDLVGYPMRIVEIKHVDEDTVLYLEEDEETAMERITNV